MFNELITNIENISTYLLFNEVDKVRPLLETVATQFVETIPKMLQLYMNPKMEKYKGDIQYWPQQAQKVLNLIEGRDRFAIIDALYFEARPNLLEFEKICNENGLKLS